jgi:hypothetical protein
MDIMQPGLEQLKAKLGIYQEIEKVRSLTEDEQVHRDQLLVTLSKAADW